MPVSRRVRWVVLLGLLGLTSGALVLQSTGISAPPPFSGRFDLPVGAAQICVEEVEPLPGRRLLIARVPRRAGVRLRAVLLADLGKLGSLSAEAERLGALVGINGDYHHLHGQHRHRPQAFLIDQGNVLAPDTATPGYEASFWIDRSGVPHVSPVDSSTNVRLAIGSGPRLLEGGALAPGLAAVTLPGYVHSLARSAVGFGEDELILAATRQAPRGGISHADMARALLALGCREALALDGGPSTTLWAHSDWRGGVLVNVPPGLSDTEPPLASALFVFAPRANEAGLK